MHREHHYEITCRWTGNLGEGTGSYRAYSRQHEFIADGKTIPLPASSQAGFRGDASRYNPEELLLASLSGCHMLWVLHLCADAGIVITEYEDPAVGTMIENGDGAGQFIEVILRPQMRITDRSRTDEAVRLHAKAHELCFISRSVNFPVRHQPAVLA